MNRLAATMMVLAVVAGPPLLAVLWLTSHPWRWPTRAQTQAWLQQPVTATTIIAACVTVVVLGWLTLLCYLAKRAGQLLRAWWHHLRDVPLPPPAQMTASSMAGIAALTMPAATAGDILPATTPVAAPEQQLPGAEPNSNGPAEQTITIGQAGLDLPSGGWISTGMAAAVAATAALIWQRRRRAFQPAPPSPHREQLRDRDLHRLPETAEAITAARPGALYQADHPPALLDQLPAGAISIIGPGAAAAARGLIVAAALSTLSGKTPTTTVCIDRSDLTRLLPETDVAALTAVGIQISDTPKPAAPPPSGHADDGGRHIPPAEPATSHTTRIRLTADPNATVTWHIAADGTEAGTANPQRFCVLTAQNTTDLLTLVHQAHQNPRDTATEPHPPTNHPAPAPLPQSTTTTGRLQLIGGCELTVGGSPVRLRRRAGLQILAYLAVHADGATRTDLIRACWPGTPPATITQRLHTTLTDLRRQLQPLLGADPIHHDGHHYHLNTQTISTDLHRWRTTANTAAHSIDPRARREACRTLINLCHGELAAGHHWPWIDPAREALRRDVQDAAALIDERVR
ncbi:AfsR/SARP family transcriptional regulator [Paractinoplanes rishiriensis]|nr:hypothetical protein [Actinoplanes rishiriensis]